ncbi:MAG: hypothetical protein B0D91_11900 [Oceanospirillales bacterium LUC14_002_19_P2]|nr:MAG: hypothetical protein B0D91_11900 [Oceanospirillales bacterium LUC14_002_19_P2]
MGSTIPFPNTIEKILGWKIEPFIVEVMNTDRIMPRSGANTSLTDKLALLVGCGSVGSELADKLGASGIGYLDIMDPDHFSVSNIYRHTLDQNFINHPKSASVAWHLTQKYPWIKSQRYTDYLLGLRSEKLLSKYDLIIIAIGSPTHERLFHEYISLSGAKTPVIYTWLEGYGVGGHAVLDVPSGKGCLRCAYVDTETGKRGLGSNLNFLQSDQNIVKNYAGCGEMFLPYGAISSTQTALIAADLAINFLEGHITESVKTSWKGDRSSAEAEGLTLTRRYENFNASLQKQPLYHPLSDICTPKEVITYQHENIRLCIPLAVLDQLSAHKQNTSSMPEAAGLLIGYIKADGDVWIDRLTTPKATDIRQRSYFKLDAKLHQKEVDECFDGSDGVLGYLGTWHTHPQSIPVPSKLDVVDWKTHDQQNMERQLFFIVVGLDKTSVYTIVNNQTVELLPLEE